MICEWFSNINILYEYMLTVIITHLTGIILVLGTPRYALASLGFTWLTDRLIYCYCKYGCEEFEMFNYIVLLYHVTWPDDFLICLYLTSDSWHLTSVLDMLLLDTWYLTLDIWHRYLTCYHLTPDTSHLVYNTWQLTCYHLLDMLSHGTSTLDLILWHLTGYYYTWNLYYIAYSWLSLLQGLDMIIILLPDIWYSWTPVLLNSCIPEPL